MVMDDVIDSWQLRMFSTLSRTGSFTETARHMSLTQSAVSHALRKLEQDMGSKLLHRNGRSLGLTAAGQRLLLCADAVLQQMAKVRADLTTLNSEFQGQLRLACPADAASHLLPPVLREFRECFPQYTLTVHPGDGQDPARLLDGQAADLVVGIEPENTAGLVSGRLFSDHLVFLVRAGHPWTDGVPPDRERLGSEQFLLPQRSVPAMQEVETHFLRQGVRIHAFVELGSSAALVEMAKLGLGVGIAPAWIAASEITQGTVRALPIPGLHLERHWAVLHHRERRLSLVEETFIGLCRSALRGYGSGTG
ncbi:MAG: LysR family transcriptional regulator [Verrucomicrobiaceae bacterium]|nr:MAG: LysR family transcriptional regulator [Verrucomicrobiaceae bacterium]